jgi:hypothetical protein
MIVGKVLNGGCATNQAYTLHLPHEQERLQILANIARDRWGYFAGVYGNAVPHPRVQSGGVHPVRPDAPGVASCLNRRVCRPPTDGRMRGRSV